MDYKQQAIERLYERMANGEKLTKEEVDFLNINALMERKKNHTFDDVLNYANKIIKIINNNIKE